MKGKLGERGSSENENGEVDYLNSDIFKEELSVFRGIWCLICAEKKKSRCSSPPRSRLVSNAEISGKQDFLSVTNHGTAWLLI